VREESDMGSANDRYFEYVLDRVRGDRYPSGELMDRIESALASREHVQEYLDVLFEKVEDSRYPSKQLLDRIARLAQLA
jgi:hypothetical protein